MTNVQSSATGVREHIQNVLLGLVHVAFGSFERLFLLPVRLPLGLHFGEGVGSWCSGSWSGSGCFLLVDGRHGKSGCRRTKGPTSSIIASDRGCRSKGGGGCCCAGEGGDGIRAAHPHTTGGGGDKGMGDRAEHQRSGRHGEVCDGLGCWPHSTTEREICPMSQSVRQIKRGKSQEQSKCADMPSVRISASKPSRCVTAC